MLVVDSVISFAVGALIFTVVLLCATIIGNPRPLLWAVVAGAVMLIGSMIVLVVVQVGSGCGRQE